MLTVNRSWNKLMPCVDTERGGRGGQIKVKDALQASGVSESAR